MQRRIFLLLFVTLSLVFQEIVLRYSIMQTWQANAPLRLVLFNLSYALAVLFVVSFFNLRWSRVLLSFVLISVTTTVLSLDLYYRVMGDFFSFVLSGDAWRGITFVYRIRLHLQWFHGLYFLPLLVWLFVWRKTTIPPYQKRMMPLGILVLMLITFISALMLIDRDQPFESDSPFNFSDYDVYQELPSAYQFIHEFGVFTYVRRDIQSIFEVRRVNLEESEDDIAAFLAGQKHDPNVYTGALENKNLIFIVAESLDYFAIHEDLTPTLYKLYHDAWQMKEFHAPHYFRNTADTEFMVHTGFYPNRLVQLSMEAYELNTFPMTLPRLFEHVGYETFAYHNYVDHFYPRRTFLTETIGFSIYQDAIDMGLLEPGDVQAGSHPWPSDDDMLKVTLDDWIDEPRFYTYYLTVSGHMPYNEDNPQVAKNLPLVLELIETLELPIEHPELIGYLAAQLELEAMLTTLLEALEEHQRLDDTVIVLMSDHYPYGVDLEELILMHPEKDLEDTLMNLHRVPFLIYHPELTKTQFSHLFSSVDVTPTLANLFNLPFEAGMTVGTDALNADMNTVRFQNGSLRNRYFELDIVQQYRITHHIERYTDEDVMLFFNEMIFLQSLNQNILMTDYFAPNDDD